MTLPTAEVLGSAYSIDVYLAMVLGKRPEGTEVGWFLRGQTDYEWQLLPKIDRPALLLIAVRAPGHAGTTKNVC